MRKTIFAALALSASLIAAPAFADGSADAGAALFKKRCSACHAIGPDAKNKVGPALTGVYGKEIGSNPDYKYSKALLAKKAEGVIWDDSNLDAWLTKPRDFIKGTKMGYAGDKDPQERQDLIAYLASFSE